jgi:hypothetical protein
MSEATSADQHEPVTQKLIALSRGAHQNVDIDDPVGYWYRLGQRNAYAEAAGLVIAGGNDSLAFTIAERITNALSQGCTEVAELARAGHGRVQLEVVGEAAPALTWMGPVAFHARYGDLPDIDHDFGARMSRQTTIRSRAISRAVASSGPVLAHKLTAPDPRFRRSSL